MNMSTTAAFCGHRRQHKILSKDRERELICLAQAGDKGAGSELLASFRPLVLSLVQKHKPSADLLPSDLVTDLFAAGMAALWNAIFRFDARKDCRLSTYATPWIEGEIGAAIKADRRHGGCGENSTGALRILSPQRP